MQKKHSKILVAFLFTIIFITHPGYAQESIEIGKKYIPLAKGSLLEENRGAFQGRGKIKAKINIYSVDLPAKEVIDFYHSYFQTNAWIILGGISGQDIYNAMLKKDNAQLTILIYPDEVEAKKTFIKFIW